MNAELRALLGSAPRRRHVDVRAWVAGLPRPRRIVWRPNAELGFDVALLAGLGSVAAGCGWIFPPAAPIVGGLFLAVIAMIAGRPDPEPPQLEARSETWFADGGATHPVDEDD